MVGGEEQHDVVTEDDINMYVAFNSSLRTRKALEHLKEMFYHTQCFKPEEPQPFSTFYHEGQRDVVGYIMECIARVKKVRFDDVSS